MLNLDKLVLTLGVWNENTGKQNEIGVYFDDFQIAFEPSGTVIESSVDGEPVAIKRRDEFWNKRIVHVNGEHTYKVIDR